MRKRPEIPAAVFLVAMAAVVILWIVYAAPGYAEKERVIRDENASMEKDIADIEAMAGSTIEIEARIKDVENRIGEKYQRRSTTGDDAVSLIKEICDGSGALDLAIETGKERLISPAGKYAPALYSVEVSVFFIGKEKTGVNVIRGLENSELADFEVTSFAYRVAPTIEDENDENADEINSEIQEEEPPLIGEWVVTAEIYYYL